MHKKEARGSRKLYGRPEIRRIELKPEENLAAGCKTMSSMQPGSMSPAPCTVGSCFDIGS